MLNLKFRIFSPSQGRLHSNVSIETETNTVTLSTPQGTICLRLYRSLLYMYVFDIRRLITGSMINTHNSICNHNLVSLNVT